MDPVMEEMNVEKALPSPQQYVDVEDAALPLNNMLQKVAISAINRKRKRNNPMIEDGGKKDKTESRRKLRKNLFPEETPQFASKDIIDSALVSKLPMPVGRAIQMDRILVYVRNNLLSKTSGCMYIYGDPGTGKTTTVSLAISVLKLYKDLPDFKVVSINGTQIALLPRQAYVEIYKQLTGRSVACADACILVGKWFTKSRLVTPTLLFVDEIDALCERRKDLLPSIMQWASCDSAQLTVLTIAKSINVKQFQPDKNTSNLKRLCFPPYTRRQLQIILAKQYEATCEMPLDALHFIAKKVASTTGDARQALALCTRALELKTVNKRRSVGLAEAEQAWEEALINERDKNERELAFANALAKANALEGRRHVTRPITSRMLAIRSFIESQSQKSDALYEPKAPQE